MSKSSELDKYFRIILNGTGLVIFAWFAGGFIGRIISNFDRRISRLENEELLRESVRNVNE